MAGDEVLAYSSWRSILSLALPAIVQNAAYPAVLTTQTALLGLHSTAALAAYSSVGMTATVLTTFFIFFVDGVAAKVGRSVSQRRWRHLRTDVQLTFLSAGALGATTAALFALLWPGLERGLFGLADEVRSAATPFWRLRAAMVPLLLLNMACTGLLQGLGRVDVAAAVRTAGSVLELGGSFAVLGGGVGRVGMGGGGGTSLERARLDNESLNNASLNNASLNNALALERARPEPPFAARRLLLERLFGREGWGGAHVIQTGAKTLPASSASLADASFARPPAPSELLASLGWVMLFCQLLLFLCLLLCTLRARVPELGVSLWRLVSARGPPQTALFAPARPPPHARPFSVTRLAVRARRLDAFAERSRRASLEALPEAEELAEAKDLPFPLGSGTPFGAPFGAKASVSVGDFRSEKAPAEQVLVHTILEPSMSFRDSVADSFASLLRPRAGGEVPVLLAGDAPAAPAPGRNDSALSPGLRSATLSSLDPATLSFLRDSRDMFLRSAVLQSTFIFSLAAAARLGTSALAAHAVVGQIWVLVQFALDGLSMAGIVLGSRLLEAGQEEGVGGREGQREGVGKREGQREGVGGRGREQQEAGEERIELSSFAKGGDLAPLALQRRGSNWASQSLNLDSALGLGLRGAPSWGRGEGQVRPADGPSSSGGRALDAWRGRAGGDAASRAAASRRRLYRRVLAAGLVVGSLCGAVCLLFPAPLQGLFASSPEVLAQLGGGAWTAMALAQPVNGLTFVLNGLAAASQQFRFVRNNMALGFALVFAPALAVQALWVGELWAIWLANALVSAWRAAGGAYLFCYALPKKQGKL